MKKNGFQRKVKIHYGVELKETTENEMRKI